MHPSPPLDSVQVMVIVWRLRGNIIRTALCWIVWHNVHSPQHTYVSSSYRSNRLGLSHRDPYTVHRGGCLELYYCNMVEWFWWDSSLISTTNWFPSLLWRCWFGHLACKNRRRNDLLCVEWDVKPYTPTHASCHKSTIAESSTHGSCNTTSSSGVHDPQHTPQLLQLKRCSHSDPVTLQGHCRLLCISLFVSIMHDSCSLCRIFTTVNVVPLYTTQVYGPPLDTFH